MASPPEAPNSAVRRFSAVQAVSLGVKIAAAGVALYILLRFLGVS